MTDTWERVGQMRDQHGNFFHATGYRVREIRPRVLSCSIAWWCRVLNILPTPSSLLTAGRGLGSIGGLAIGEFNGVWKDLARDI